MSSASYEQLMALRMLVGGGLHEAQINHLMYWPRVVFSHCTKSAFTFKPETKEIEFRLFVKGKQPVDMESRLEFFDIIVKRLLGETFRVRVKVDKKIVLNSRGRKEKVGGG